MSQLRTNFIHRDDAFTCEHCGKAVPQSGKSCRNHCNHCLYSLHVDQEVPGDRASECHGLMAPLRLESGSRKGYLNMDIVHQCGKCRKTIKNNLAEDDQWEVLSRNGGDNLSDEIRLLFYE